MIYFVDILFVDKAVLFDFDIIKQNNISIHIFLHVSIEQIADSSLNN